jgi:steroid delta-isomerase-like uncharacterized protein
MTAAGEHDMTTTSMTVTDLKRFITEYTDAVWNHGDGGAMERYYAPDYIHHDVSRPDVRTLADYQQWARDLLAGLSDLRVVIDALVAEDGTVVKRWTAHGLHTSVFAGIAPTGRAVSFAGVSTYRIDGERIVESWYLYDLFGLLQQLQAAA